MRVVLAVVVLIAACGDNGAPREPLFTGLSGSRIKLQWYLYLDGARQLETAAFYDAHLHVRCEPKVWSDGVKRCTPLADATVFRDDECLIELGRAMSDRKPKYFIGHDRIAGELRATRLLRAGARAEAAPTTFFERRDGACVQISEPETVAYYEIDSAADIGGLSEVWDEMVEGERLGLRVLAGIDLLSAPVGYYDHELASECVPEVRPDGSSACVPTAAIAPAHFADPYCEESLVVATEPPRALRVADPNGCALYHGAGSEAAGLVYRREGASCVRASLSPGEHAYHIGAPLALAPVERSVGAQPKQRLQRITIAADSMLTLDGRLYDSATRTDCRSIGNGELAICAPVNAATGTRVYANDKCGRELLVADLPRVQCTPSTFAIVDEISIHAIGAPHTGPLYVFDAGGTCRPRVPTAGIPHVLGPPIPPTTFVAGVVFSER
jgi:hypothetical protein